MFNNNIKDLKTNGIFIVNKPIGITSFKVVNTIKKKFNFNKVGHCGTLDPLASGVLVIVINKATKISNYFMSSNKTYEVKMRFFIKTDTGDMEGRIILEKKPFVFTIKSILKALNFFNGKSYNQIPPIYSAIKYQGKKLYEYARSNINVNLISRKVAINKIYNINYNSKTYELSFNVNCSKGTYIRSLVADIAKKLDTIATLFVLKRVRSGAFDIKNATILNDLSINNLIITYDAIKLNNLPIKEIEYKYLKLIKNGNKIQFLDLSFEIIFISYLKNIIAIYQKINNSNIFKCKKGM